MNWIDLLASFALGILLGAIIDEVLRRRMLGTVHEINDETAAGIDTNRQMIERLTRQEAVLETTLASLQTDLSRLLATQSELNIDLDQKQKKLDQLAADASTATAARQAIRTEHKDFRDTLAQARQHQNDLNKAIWQAKQRLAQQSDQRQQLQTQLTQLQAELTETDQKLEASDGRQAFLQTELEETSSATIQLEALPYNPAQLRARLAEKDDLIAELIRKLE